MRMVTLRVTAAHIADCCIVSFSYGPLGRAIRDRMLEHTHVQIVRDTLFLCRAANRFWLPLPPRALQFMAHCQQRRQVNPIAFRIELPAEMMKPARIGVNRKPPQIATFSHGSARRSDPGNVRVSEAA